MFACYDLLYTGDVAVLFLSNISDSCQKDILNCDDLELSNQFKRSTQSCTFLGRVAFTYCT